jgi:lipoprotein-anchoring transpeptidase ErfK/SrfK
MALMLVRTTIIVALLATACSTSQSAPPPVKAVPSLAEPSPVPSPEPEPEPEPERSLIAEATVPTVRVFRDPEDRKPFTTIENPGPWEIPRVFLVRQVRDDWLRTYLPMRPNEASGWIESKDVKLLETTYRLLVDLSRNRLTVFHRDSAVMREPVAVGTGGTPTPTGSFYITMLVRPTNQAAYGPYAFGLSAYSEVLFTFAGGDGQVGIHGTADTASIGRDVSHGCIRVRNDAITRMANLLPLGTPVEIRR